ncbi:MAG: hypothetical protein R2762_26000 [Bryobacteraceae bacterium]
MTDFRLLLDALTGAGVDFVLVDRAAAIAHGSTRLTLDLDIVYSRTPEKIAKVAQALAPYSPYLRGVPPGLPFRLDPETIQRGLTFTLTTSLGQIDLLGEIAGGGFHALLPQAMTRIAVKRAAGRPKDLEAIAGLEAIRDEINQLQSEEPQ